MILLTGCAALTNPSRVHKLEEGGSYALDLDASRRGAYILKKEGPVGICAEPAPDVSVEFVSELMAEVQIPNTGIDAKTRLEMQSKIIELAGRTSTVLMLRESLYRLCELGLNGKLESEQIEELYRMALKTALMLAEKDLMEERKEIIQGLDDPQLKNIFESVIK